MQHIEIDRTDEEREELVKQWISDYWLWVVMAVLLSIAAVYGINYYKQSKINALNDLAVELEQVQQQLADKQVDMAATSVNNLQTAEKQSSFTSVATLNLAKYYFDDKVYDKAATQYAWLVKNSADSAMRDIGRLRQARALANAKQFTTAANVLGTIENKNNVTEANLLKGDILLTSGQFDKAKIAYTSLQNSTEINAEVIEQRLNLLNIKQQQLKP